MRKIAFAFIIWTVACRAQGQLAVKHLQDNAKGLHADAVWAGDTLYIAGQLAVPVIPADPAKGSLAVYKGDTKEQVTQALQKIQVILEGQGLGMGDVVKLTIFLVGDPALGNKLDFAGMQAAYAQFFGTKEQPFKPARTVVQIAGLAAQGAMVQMDAIAVRSK